MTSQKVAATSTAATAATTTVPPSRTTATTTTTTTTGASPSIAQEIVSWYYAHLDELQPHSVNVQTILIGPLIAVTASILNAPPNQVPTTTATANREGNQSTTTTTTPAIVENGNSSIKNIESVVTNENTVATGVHDVMEASASSVMFGGTTTTTTTTDWKDYLQNKFQLGSRSATENFQLDDPGAVYETLSPRAQARLDAFVEGICLAIDNTNATAGPTGTTNNTSSNATTSESTDFYTPLGIHEGLAGFKQYDKSKSNYSSSSSTNANNNNRTKSQSQVLSSSSSTSSLVGSKKVTKKVKKQPQIGETELIVRLDLYFRTLQRCYHLGRDCVVSVESNRAIKARAQFVVVSFVDTVGTVRQQGPVLTRLLTALTKELLAVPVLSETLVRAIRRIVSNYVHTTSFASLAFLSSPETAAETRLKPSILQYLKYLQQHWQHCELECDIERMLSAAIDPVVRNTFKTCEFQSIGHLLEVCQSFRNELRNIELPPYNIYDVTMNKVDDAKVRQAIRDLKREVITLNGHVLPPVSSRADLIHLLSQMLNSRSFSSYPKDIAANMRSKKKKRSHKMKREQQQQVVTKTITHQNSNSYSPSDDAGDDPSESESYIPNSTDYNYNSETTVTDDVYGVGLGLTAAQDASARRRSFRLSTVDLLTKRLLLAAGRTSTGGDAYFVVRDLFGGPDVEVVPSKNNFLYNTTFYRPLSAASGTIDLIVRLTNVTIKCHASFDVYPKNMVGECEPLIQVHTTTSETIQLQEVRLADLPESKQNEFRLSTTSTVFTTSFSNPKGQHYPSDSDDFTSTNVAEVVVASPKIGGGDDLTTTTTASGPNTPTTTAIPTGSIMVIQERKTEKSGYRTLSVRPALYEMVENFNTPS